MKKILLLALPLMVMCFASCEKNENEMEITSYLFWEYDLWSSYQRDLYGDDPYPAFGKEEELYGEYGIQCTFYGENLYSTSGFDAVWSVSCDADWCHYESEVINPFIDSQRINSRLRINLTIDEKTSGEIRYAEINLTCNGNPFSITITQYGTPTVTVSTPGTLTQELANKDLLYASSLKISGRLNDKDLETIKGLREIETLDLTEAIIDDLPDEMFYQNETIKSVKLPETITTIHSKTFAFSSLEYVYFPANIEKIEDGESNYRKTWRYTGAFANSNLTTIEFAQDSRLKYIGDYAFAGAGKERYVDNITGNIHCEELKIVFPASVETIGDGVFHSNIHNGIFDRRFTDVSVSFEEQSLLKTVGTIGAYSLDFNALNCQALETFGYISSDDARGYVAMTLGINVPPICSGVSSGNYFYLYVPKGCVGAYYDADGWKEFNTIKEIE